MSTQTLASLFSQVNSKVKQSPTVKKEFDFIVLGLGSMGSSTCYHLAKQGYSVLGLDKFDITHENGSHAGQSRLIRQAYFEHPDYVPLLQEAYTGWKKLENEANSQLFYKTGILYAGNNNDFLISGSLRSAQQYNLEVEKITWQDQEVHFPQFNLPSHYSTIFEPNAGFVTPERAILTYVDQALRHGAEVHSNEEVLSYKAYESGIAVRTKQENYRATKLIITAGAYTGNLLPFLTPKLKVTKQTIAWVNIANSETFHLDKMPCWGINQEEMAGLFYGFPILDHEVFGEPQGMKIGYHYPGVEIDPEDNMRSIDAEDKDIIVNFMEQFMPGRFRSFKTFKSCLYTYSPDDNFIIDHHPDQKNVVFAAGFSGHGFKFIPVIGQALADLAINGNSILPIDFLKLSRLP